VNDDPPASAAAEPAAPPAVSPRWERLVDRATPLAARIGLGRADLVAMVESWRWRATWGATVGAMASIAAMKSFVDVAAGHGGGLDVSYNLRWVILIVFMVLGGMLGDLYGRRRLLMGALAVVTVATTLASLTADNLAMVGTLRLVSGVCGAVALPLTLALVRTSLKQQVLGVGIVVYMSGYAVGLSLPYIGRGLALWLGEAYALVPILLAGAVALDAVSEHAPHDEPVKVRQADLVGVALCIIGTACLAVGVQHATAEDTRWTVSLAWVAVGLALLALFAAWQGRRPDPALDLRRLRERWFVAALLSGAVVSFGLQASWRVALALLVDFFGQLGTGQLTTLVIAGILGALAGCGTSAALASRVNGGRLIASGIGGMAVGMLLGAALLARRPDLDLAALAIPVGLITGGLCLGTLMRTLVVVDGVPPGSAGSAAGLLDAVGYLGGIAAPVVIGTLMRPASTASLSERLAAAGATVEPVAGAPDAVRVTLGDALRGILAGNPPPGAADAAAAFQAALHDDLVLVLLVTGAGMAATAAFVWLAWRGRDRPLWVQPASEGPGTPRDSSD
jgi:MFS family permease